MPGSFCPWPRIPRRALPHRGTGLCRTPRGKRPPTSSGIHQPMGPPQSPGLSHVTLDPVPPCERPWLDTITRTFMRDKPSLLWPGPAQRQRGQWLHLVICAHTSGPQGGRTHPPGDSGSGAGGCMLGPPSSRKHWLAPWEPRGMAGDGHDWELPWGQQRQGWGHTAEGRGGPRGACQPCADAQLGGRWTGPGQA